MSGKSADTRENIRRAAYSCFRDHGYYEASVDAICAMAGVSKGSFYYHYASKQACYVDILDTWTREVISEVQKQFEQATLAGNPFAALQAAFRRENVRGRLIVPLWLEFTVLARREPAIREVLSRFYHRARLAIAEMLRPFVGPFIALDELDGLSSAILGLFIGVLTQELADPGHTEAGEASDAALKVLGRLLARTDAAAWGASADGESRRPRAPQLAGVRIDDDAFAGFVAPHSASVRQVTAELRDLVLSTVPAADERLIRGWRVVAYDLGGLLCSLKPQRAHVDVGFYQGAELDDPGALLTGRGKHVRHVRVRPGDLDDSALVGLIRQAAALRGAD
ncbi:MAG: TetR family transcriptional regulator [Deltaproteobacteria bacterium]|nr:MAG: TetR family transcriptional regulator [Deltaproteobacteria bacterium]